jgi:nucleotide-binding universal stress UspA family protein
MDTIVVGIDGSPAAAAALAWAVDEARVHDARLHVVYAWNISPLVYASPYAVQATEGLLEAEREAATTLATTALEGVDTSGVDVQHSVLEGLPAETLLEAAENADLLVVGSRGRGGFAGLLLGSVSQQCAQHAKCPVVIVRAPSD